MLIKRVVIQGFKTFAKRTEFLFDPGITAVVGPNGSGKSNVVDAIRWCLGEQSFSLLRSKKTSDVIFSGSDKRARLGMAEVSLTLDNQNGAIPIDFAEVEITRRAYRDGENEYRLNGKQVRLQDVTELLAQTGLGKRTYAVIGQGLIDQVLSFSPEERRVLFEEAAGITGYQMKRATTLRRLDATQQNLTRVQDILAELSPRLKYLKRQAERAKEYEELARELRNLLREWYGLRWHMTLRQLAEHHTAEEALRTQVANRQQVLAAQSRHIEALRSDQANVRSTLANRHKESSTFHRQAESAERDLAVIGERLRQVQARAEENQRELVALGLEQETLAQRHQTIRATATAAQAECAQRQQAVETVQQAVNQRQQDQGRLQRTLDATRRHFSQAQNQRVESTSRLTQLAERQSVLQQEQAVQRQALVEAEQGSHAADARLRDAETQLSQTEQQTRQAQGQITQFEQSLGSLNEQLRNAEQQRQETNRTLDRLQTRYDLLRRLREEGAGYASGVRAVLQASQLADGHQPPTTNHQPPITSHAGRPLRGVLGAVASLIQIPARLDKAIETAIGGAFQDVITETWEDARQAIDYLKAGSYGRATFLPLDRLHVGPKINAPRAPGILGNALDLVNFDDQIANAAAQLLNRIWIAQDLASARAALDRHNSGGRPTLVTLAGEIIRPGGAVTGGSDASRRDDSVMARERELRDLPVQLEEARRSARAAASRCSELARQVEATQATIEKEKHTLLEQTRRERTLRQQIEELRRHADRSEQTARWQHERLEQIMAELARLAEQDVLLQSEFAKHQIAETQAAAIVAGAETAVHGAGATELLQQLADLRAAAAEAQGHLRSQQTMLDNQTRNAQRITEQIQGRQARDTDLVRETAELNRRMEEEGQNLHQLRSKLEELRQQIEPLEAQASRLAAAQAAEETRERNLQQTLRKDEGSWNAAQLQLQRTQDQLQQLRHEIEQDLGLVTLEQSDDLAYQPPLPWDKYVEQLPIVANVPDTLEDEVRDTRTRVARASNVNSDAPREYEETAGRHDFLLTQSADLEAAAADLRKVLKELDLLMEVAFERTFKAVSEQFVHFFQKLFNGGTAELVLTAPQHIATTGVDIIARPPGKRPQSLALLSGGERSLSACALIFAILRVSPTPFCVLDEVDAALDEANVDRFRLTVEDLSNETQFIIVTHNRRTLEGANAIYGVSMGNDGVSTVISLRLEGDNIVQGENGTNHTHGPSQRKEIEETVQL